MSQRPLSFLTAVIVVLAGGAVGWWLGVMASNDRRPGNLSELELPVLTGDAIDGPGRRSGEVSLLEFWASWCGPCRVQAKVLAPLHAQYGDRIRFFAVNVGESRQEVEDFLAAEPMAYEVLIDEDGQRSSSAGIFGLPTIVILDAQGSEVLRSEGLTGRRELTEALEAALAVPDQVAAATESQR